MDGHHYANGNVYNYGYDPNQMYYVDPYMQQTEYYPQGQQYGGWGWQAQGYESAQQPVYGAYAQGAEYDYNNQYDNGMVYEQQGFVNYDGHVSYGRQSVPSSRSKHSYSQNRSKNRQRPEHRQEFSVNSTDNTNNNANNSSNDSETKQTLKENKENETSRITSQESSATAADDTVRNSERKVQEASKNRGRFQGTDSRSRKFDNRQQIVDRQRGYDKNYQSQKADDASVTSRKNESASNGDKSKKENNMDEKSDSKSGARPKSVRDSRNNTGYNRDKQFDRKFKQDKARNDNRNDSDRSRETSNKDVDSNVKGTKDSLRQDQTPKVEPVEETLDVKDNSGRKKKKEYQVYSSSSPREWQAKHNQYNSTRNAQERYNYRGQDYNKRHKEFPTQSIERGGDRTKLTVGIGERGANADNEGGEDDDDSADYSQGRMVNDGQRKSKNVGPQRGTRFKQKGKVDESQRGVLIEQLSRGSYECMVCCEAVRATNAVWSCSNCYHVFHMRCIKKWAKSPAAVVTGADKDGWRCPACQNLSFKFPNQYRCFCGKVRDPEMSRIDTPHSCGDVCQKDRGDGCKHPCTILCHPGPCPECNATITKSCDCGKTRQSAKCGQTTVIKCDQTCERMLNCGRHFCKAKCHSGVCDKCEEIIKQDCYGGHESREVVCGSEESFTESYSCNTTCSKTLDCGHHTCDKLCHRAPCASCPTLPTNTTHCPCGAKPLTELTSEARTSCLDPIPTCGAVCNKVLGCGPPGNPHRCEKVCHEGPCGPCSGTTLLSCRCMFMEKEFKCSEIDEMTGEGHQFLCDKRCNRKKSCGRHKCGQPCCVKDEHPCELLCGRKLPCGLHKCTEPCHKTNCPPCLMASFDELLCYCGAEVLYPPIPCGTKPPECHRPCTRPHGCDHPVRHNCHSDEKCPPCTELTKKMCMGNHVLRANIPCHLTDISCGMKCSKSLPCGEHSCIRTCHKGTCVEEGQVCQQLCQRKRELCDHICGAICHGETPCPQTPCKAKVLVKCACGHRESETQCSVGTVSSDTDYPRLAMQSLKDSIQGIMGASSTVNIGKLNMMKLGQGRVLECNEECALIERNRRLALALEIQNPDLSSKLGNPTYTDFLKEYAKKDSVFVAGIEKALSDLVQSAKQSKQASRSHAFPSMNMNQRRLVHELAEFYGCQTQSYDYEPKKNVVATAARDKCWLPSVTLTAQVQRELHPRAPPPIPHVHKEDSLRMTSLAARQSTSVLGEKDPTSSNTPDGWQVIGKKTKKASATGSKSAIATIDKFESNLADICSSGTINYDQLTKESQQALKSEPVVDYFDFTVN